MRAGCLLPTFVSVVVLYTVHIYSIFISVRGSLMFMFALANLLSLFLAVCMSISVYVH